MIDTEDHDERNNPVRKLLRALPKVNAREDFDGRLKNRLRKVQSVKRLWRGGVLIPQRAAGYVVSLFAVVAAGAIAYFSLVRTPPPQVEHRQEQTDVKQELPREERSAPEPSAGGFPPPSSEGRGETHDQLGEKPPSGIAGERQPSFPRESVQGEMRRRGLLREVGGTGRGAEQSPESSHLPFLRALPNAALQLLHDSIVRADSVKQDSLLKLLQEDRRD